MPKTFHATYDGEVFLPEESITLSKGSRVEITVHTNDDVLPERKSFLKTAKSLKLKGPTDLSENLKDFLHNDKS